MNSIKNAVHNGINGAVNFVRRLPGQALSALGNIGSKLYNSGKAMIDGFKDGIVNAFNNRVNAVKNRLSRIRNFFPFSPAKEGPFSGKGWTFYSGQSMSEGLADGMAIGNVGRGAPERGTHEGRGVRCTEHPRDDSTEQQRLGPRRGHRADEQHQLPHHQPGCRAYVGTTRKASAYIGVEHLRHALSGSSPIGWKGSDLRSHPPNFPHFKCNLRLYSPNVYPSNSTEPHGN